MSAWNFYSNLIIQRFSFIYIYFKGYTFSLFFWKVKYQIVPFNLVHYYGVDDNLKNMLSFKINYY